MLRGSASGTEHTWAGQSENCRKSFSGVLINSALTVGKLKNVLPLGKTLLILEAGGELPQSTGLPGALLSPCGGFSI